jgi:hypothetical protein
VTVYVIAAIPVAARPAAEAAVAPFLLGPGEVWAVPLSPGGSGPVSHYGLCAPVDDGGALYAMLPALAAAITGGAYHTVPVGGYVFGRDWIDWLSARGLAPAGSHTGD